MAPLLNIVMSAETPRASGTPARGVRNGKSPECHLFVGPLDRATESPGVAATLRATVCKAHAPERHHRVRPDVRRAPQGGAVRALTGLSRRHPPLPDRAL